MEKIGYVAEPQNLDAVFAALADPTRRAILSRLLSGAATAGELAAPFAISKPAISRHLKVLEKAGLIERSVEAQWRRCRLVSTGLTPAAEWIETYRRFWEGQLDALDSYLKQQDPEGDKDDDDTKR